MITTSLVDATTQVTNNSPSSNVEVNYSAKKDTQNEVIQQTETTSLLSSITLSEQNKTENFNTELVEQGELITKGDSKVNQTNLKNTTTPLTTAILVDQNTELTNVSSRIDDKNNISKSTENSNEILEKTNLANTAASYSQVKATKKIDALEKNTKNSSKLEEVKSDNAPTSIISLPSKTVSYESETSNSNTQVVELKNSENKIDLNVSNSDVKNTVEKSLTRAKLADTNENLSKNSSSRDDKIVDSKKLDKLNNIAQEIDESTIPKKPSFNANAASYNKDLSGAKDNIKSFSNSLRDDDDEEERSNESVKSRTSKKKEKIEEIILLGKIEKNAPLKTGTVDVSAMTIKGNGNYIETGRASKTHAIRINFKMFNNENVAPGNKEVFIVIQNPKGKVINEKGKFTVRSGKELFYSDETMAYYDGRNMSISILSGKFIQKIVKGTYIVKVYIERYLTGQTLLILS